MMVNLGFPGPVNDVASRTGLVSGYDRRTRNPAWVSGDGIFYR